MASYRLVFKQSVSGDLRSIPMRDVARILKRIGSLAEEPRPVGCQKLSGGAGPERYRLRQGNYRILYEIAEQGLAVTVVKVGHRRDVYRRH